MLLKEKEIILSDGRHCILRSARTEDAEDLIQYLKITSAETPYLMREPEEIALTSAQEKDFLQTMEEAKRELPQDDSEQFPACFPSTWAISSSSLLASSIV